MRLLNGKLVQQCLLIAILGFIFYDGLWGGAPRADHLIYLHNMWGQDSLGEVISRAPTWNRDLGHGDAILFRPLLFLQLGLFYHFFGYEFWLWQLGDLLLHIAIVLLLHSCFWQTRLSGTFWPLLLALPLAVSQFGAELVLWNHLGGYLLFALLALASFRLLIGYAREGRGWFGIASLATAFAGSFLYETGTLVCFLIAAWLFGRAWIGETVSKPHGRMLAAAFVVAGVICPTWGFVDYALRYPDASLSIAGREGALGSLALATWYALVQIAYWLAAFLLPTQFQFSAVDRAVAHLASWWPNGIAQAAVALAALLIIAGAGAVVGSRLLRQDRTFYFSVGLCALFLFGYSWVIAVGRAVPRGLDYVFYNNVYYAHIAYAAFGAVICAGMFFWRPRPAADKQPRRFSVRSLGTASFAVGLLVISAINADAAATLSSRYRYLFSPDRLEIIHALRDWHARNADRPQAYFVLGPSCRGNETIDWFDPAQLQPGKGWSAPVTFADVLFPERSFALNRRRLTASAEAPDPVECAADQVAKEDLAGSWRGRRGARYSFVVEADGALKVTDRSGKTAAVSVAGGRLEIPAWSLSGQLSRTGASLLWDDGTAWRR